MRRGKYRFQPQYRSLEIDEQKWFGIIPEARRRHMAKVHGFGLFAVDTSSISHSDKSTRIKSFTQVPSTLEHRYNP